MIFKIEDIRFNFNGGFLNEILFGIFIRKKKNGCNELSSKLKLLIRRRFFIIKVNARRLKNLSHNGEDRRIGKMNKEESQNKRKLKKKTNNNMKLNE